MRAPRGLSRTISALVATALVAAATAVTAPAAVADTRPAEGVAQTAAADSLPTVQIDGVAWQQAIAGSRVFAGGDFANARPAGAKAGTENVARANLLAYDLETGVLDASWAPNPNAQVRAVAASPDGSRVYVGGNFTSIAGEARYRIAAFDAATGALLSSFAPGVDAQVRAIVATDTTVYVGGVFTNAGGQARNRVAAFDAATGAVLPWAPEVADGSVSALTVSPDGAQVLIGGSFTAVNGSNNPGYGLARVDAVSGASLPLPINGLVRNGSTQASITSLSTDGDSFYVTGYVFGSTGNLEGAARGSWSTGALVWVEDCHGDTYAAWPQGDALYVAGHPHYCGNIGGFPQTEPQWTFYRALAFSKEATGTVTKDPHGYFNWEGNPAPTLLNWYPEINSGSYTGQGQGPWTVTGDDEYLLYGGEFTIVNNKGQQGLARFARTETAPNKQGPRLASDTWPLTGVSYQAGTARLSWGANYDRDNEDLTYTVTRNGTVVHTEVASSVVWDRPAMRFLDTGLTPGQTYTYRVRATDPFGNTAITNQIAVTVTDGDISAYSQEVLEDGAVHYWPLGEDSGTTAYDWAGPADLTTGAGVTRGTDGAIGDDAAATFGGTSTGLASTALAEQASDSLSVEAWVRTTSTRGGKIVGFGSASTGTSTSYDRHVYMDNAGRITFGTYPGAVRSLTTTTAYNDGAWHHVVATLGASGMRLYVDGRRVGQRTDTVSGQSYTGYWRVGGDSVSGWPNAPTSGYLAGSIDDVAVYPAPLTAAQVSSHWTASGRTSTVTPAPADAYGAAVHAADPDLYWRLSETTGTVAADSGPNGVAGTYRGVYTRGEQGALVGVTDTAARSAGLTGTTVSSVQSFTNPTTYSEELWFRTTTTAGGKLIGFASTASGTSGSHDRHVYMETNGRLTFGVWTGTASTITSPSAYNDGAWHHMVATQGPDGMRLYVDGVLVGTHPQTAAQNYTGYWRIFGDTTWGPQPWFAGTIDEVAVYSTVLDPATVALHHALGTTGAPPNVAPVAHAAVTATDLTVAVDGSGSTDEDGTVATYAWDFGDGSTGEGATASHTYAEAGTYTVRLTVTDDGGASAVATEQVTVVAPNQLPTAAFEPTADGLDLAVDGSGSADPDGTLATYAWDFGDGSIGEGATAAHTYAAGGTYTVTLTVTDDRGGSATAERTVTVVAPNVEPTAAFEATATGLEVSVDAGGSADPDGDLVGYAWDFGDGQTGDGATATHTYATDGTYTVTLTVTDDRGATASATAEVTVVTPPADTPFADDAFDRSTTGGWGEAGTGGAWTVSGGAANFSVANGAGAVRVTGAGFRLSAFLPVSSTSTDLTGGFTLDAMPSGSGTDVEVVGRAVSASEGYRLRLKMLATGVVRASLISTEGSTTTTLTQVNVPGLTYAAGEELRVRLQVDGSGTTALRAKVWRAGTEEPTAWTLSSTSTAAALQGAGGVGVSVYTSASSTVLPLTVRWSDLTARPVVP